MNKTPKIYVAGHRGMVGSAIIRKLHAYGFNNIVVRTHAELDLTNQEAVDAFFKEERPDQVYLAAAKVGGIHANDTYPAEFIYQNMMIEANVIHAAWKHDVTGLNRRLNALVYLNPGWEESWGGEFGIYDNTGDQCVKKIAPLFNRLVIFDSHDKSFHGLPDPINFPDEVPRRSILLYYYTKDPRPSDQIVIDEPHSALWKKRNLNDKKGNKTRDYF